MTFARETEHIRQPSKTSMLYWWPLVNNLGIPVPRTEIVPCDNLYAFYAETVEEWEERRKDRIKYMPLFHEAANKIRYPLFMRTDLFSGKHAFEATCYVSSATVLQSHISALIFESLMVDIRIMNHQALVFREYLPPDTGFYAFAGLPIGKERRYFVSEGNVLCHHPYWPKDATRFRKELQEFNGWENILDSLNKDTEQDTLILKEYAERISHALGKEYFSVDFMHSNDIWYMIDMAEGDKSWHDENCPYLRSENT